VERSYEDQDRGSRLRPSPPWTVAAAAAARGQPSASPSSTAAPAKNGSAPADLLDFGTNTTAHFFFDHHQQGHPHAGVSDQKSQDKALEENG